MDSWIQKAVPSPRLSPPQPVARCCHWSPQLKPHQTPPHRSCAHHGIAPNSRALSVLVIALAWHPGVSAECPCGVQSLGHGGSLGIPGPGAEHPSHTIAVGRANPCYPNKQQMGYPALPTHQHHGLSRLQAGGRSRHAGTHSTAGDSGTILFWVCWRFF